MTTKVFDRCMFTPTLSGSTDWTVSAAVQGYMTPAQAGVSNGDTVYYVAENFDRSQWELGSGVYTSGTLTIARTTILFSSNANAKVTFTSIPNVYIVAPAEYFAGLGGASDATLTTSDITTNNVSTSKHGFAPKAPNDATKYLDGTGVYSTPAGGGSGPGTPPTIVQHGLVNGSAGSITLGSAPVNGNLLVAFVCNPSGFTANSGWTRQAANGSGTDFCAVFTKTAGAGESTTQTPITSTPTTGILIVWELSGWSTLVATAVGAEVTGTNAASNAFPSLTNVIHLAGVVIEQNSGTIVAYNMTQDEISNTGTRRGYGGHSTATVPVAQLLATFGASVSVKTLSALISA